MSLFVSLHGLYGYDVSGTFLIDWAGVDKTGTTVMIDLTSENFLGRVGKTPEPSTWALLASGLLGLVVLSRHARRAH